MVELIVFAVAAVPLGIWVMANMVPADARSVDQFAAAYGLDPGPVARHMIRDRLTTRVRLVTLLFLDGVILPAVAIAAFGGSLGLGQGELIALGLAAGVVAILVTELVVSRPADTDRRTASLRPRDLRSYLSKSLLWGPWILAAMIIAILVATRFAPGASTHPVPRVADTERLPVSVMVVASLAAAGVPALTAAAGRWIVRRPQPFVSGDLVAADDALRAAAVRRLTALVCTALAAAATVAFYQLGTSTETVGVTSIAPLGSIVSVVVAVRSFSARAVQPPTGRRARAGHHRRAPA